MIEVILSGKMNAVFKVKNKKKIEMWKMLEKQNGSKAIFVIIKIRDIENKK